MASFHEIRNSKFAKIPDIAKPGRAIFEFRVPSFELPVSIFDFPNSAIGKKKTNEFFRPTDCKRYRAT